jgi:hypothetical protein
MKNPPEMILDIGFLSCKNRLSRHLDFLQRPGRSGMDALVSASPGAFNPMLTVAEHIRNEYVSVPDLFRPDSGRPRGEHVDAQAARTSPLHP